MFSVNGIVIDLANERLSDASGNSIVLRPQCFAVLRALSEKQNQLVTKDELIQTVWPEIAVTDDSLVQCIHEVRRALNDEQRLILRTVPKRGYRLVIPENVGGGVSAKTTAKGLAVSHRVVAVAGLLVLATAALSLWLTGRPSHSVNAGMLPLVGVLPFNAVSGDPGRSFANGMTEDLTTDLAKLSGNFVVVWNAASESGDPSRAVDEMAREQGLRYVLVGSVRDEGGQVRINAQLIDAVARQHVWAERYDGSLDDGFTLQARVARSIASAVAAALIKPEQFTKPASQPAGPDVPLSAAPANRPATVVAFENVVTSIPVDTSTASPIRVADLTAGDKGIGSNTFSLSGEDAEFFEIVGKSLYLKAGVTLDVHTKASYNLMVHVDYSDVGSSSVASNSFSLRLTDSDERLGVTNVN
jgi:TolB-like protein/DNA-binding winged helix-turn-helix (wHTH) protein